MAEGKLAFWVYVNSFWFVPTAAEWEEIAAFATDAARELRDGEGTRA
jgi:hypothetical protein